ncbi:hypothetical protein CJ030_MR8G005531 [Morella rubra]|uniref:Transposase MuDR plant domain-containing protein n=1 Tax=Morella rubra TaxID=262757 RepID=A0A6A1US73_9ROSI|nr:hypothetical protein CJ030_MR8G005531 [Morella rubra]
MASDSFVFKVHYGGRFDRSNGGCVYVDGKMAMHPDPYDCDCLSYIEVEAIVKEYGYKHGDLLFYLEPEKTLSDGLRIISGDPDILQMVAAHRGKEIIVLYVVGFEAVPVFDTVDDVDDERERRRLGIGTTWWDEALSSDDDLYDVNVTDNDNAEAVGCEEDVNMSPPSLDIGGPSFELGGHSFEVGGPSGRSDKDTEAADVEAEHLTADGLLVTPPPSPDGKDDGYMSDMIPSDILVSPPHSDYEAGEPSRSAPEFVERDLGSVTLVKGMKFPSAALFKEAVKEANIAIGKDVRFHKNTGDKVVIVCRAERCKYRVYGRKIPTEITFEIRDIQPRHRCPRRYRLSQISFRWIAKKMIDQIKSQPNISVSAIYDEVKRKWQCETMWQKCYRAKKRALEQIYGTHKEQYGRVWDYCATLRDANNNMYPVAFAIVEAELKDSWIWFLETLLGDLGAAPHGGWTFMSDRQKGLVPAFDVVMPQADHRFCVRHLYANFRDAGHRGVALKDKLWGAATAYTESEFNKKMDELKALSPDAHEYLRKIDPSVWSRSWFHTHSKSDLVVNNLCECFNSYVLQARDKPIISMVEMIRKKLMRRYQLKREGIRTCTGRLCPRAVEKLESIGEEASHCLPTYAGDGYFEVECHLKQNPEDFVDWFYTTEAYRKAYAPIIYPVPSEEQWLRTVYEAMEPPQSRAQPGRPKKLRKRGPDERTPTGRIPRRQSGILCSECKEMGHNKRTCPRLNRRKASRRVPSTAAAPDAPFTSGPPPSHSSPSTRSTRQTIRVPHLRDETPSQSTPRTRTTRKGDHQYVMKLHPNLPQLHGNTEGNLWGPQIRDATPSQSMPSTHSTRHTMQIPQLRDEESPSQSTGQPLSVPLTRSRRLSQLLSGIVEVNDNAVVAMTASRKKTPRAQTPYKEAPATESMETHPARKNTKGPSTRSTLAATGIASRIRMRRSSRLQRFRSQGASTSTKVVIDLTAPTTGKV